ncbi:MAG: winged helix-turn-helix domain-containing protein [Treponema sp.]|nr:winged helix-turn-helix domain-containing protein [Treponema sp.]
MRLAVKQKYGIDMPIRTVGEYLKRRDFTPQRPVRYTYEWDGGKGNRQFHRFWRKINRSH